KNGLVGGILKPVKEAIFGGNTDEEDALAQEYMQQALDEMSGIKAPDLKEIGLDQYSWLGDYTPQNRVIAPTIDAGQDLSFAQVDPRLAEIERLDSSAFEGVSVDPRLREEQMQSLAALQDIADRGGMTLQDEANLNRIQTDAATADRGRREAILQN